MQILAFGASYFKGRSSYRFFVYVTGMSALAKNP